MIYKETENWYRNCPSLPPDRSQHTHHLVLLQKVLVLHVDLLLQTGDRLLKLRHRDYVIRTVGVHDSARISAHAAHLLWGQVRKRVLA